VVAARKVKTRYACRSSALAALYWHFDGFKTPYILLDTCYGVTGEFINCHSSFRRLLLWRSALSYPRNLGLAAGHFARRPPALHSHHHLRNLPLPWPPGHEPGEIEDPRVHAIAQAARQLDEFRTGWLNPPAEDIGIVISPKIVEKRTLTNLYNALGCYRAQFKGKQYSPTAWQATPHAIIISLDEIETLDSIHTSLDHAALDAYGWPHALSDEQILERLLSLNLQRAAA